MLSQMAQLLGNEEIKWLGFDDGSELGSSDGSFDDSILGVSVG